MEKSNKNLVTANANLYNEQDEQLKAIWDSFVNRFDGNDLGAVFNSIKAEADSGDANASYFVARHYDIGYIVVQNEELCQRYYLKSANQGNTEAMVVIGCHLQEDPSDGAKLREAYSWFEKAADLGWVKAKAHLAKCFSEGLGVVKDEEKAYALMREAAECGQPEAQYYVALKLHKSKYEQDQQEALEYLKKSADNGYDHAQLDYGEYLVMVSDAALGCEYLKMAADQGYEEALLSLGFYYPLVEGKREEGLGILYSKSLEGSVHAMEYLALLLDEENHKVEARRWAQKAVGSGSTHSEVVRIAK